MSGNGGPGKTAPRLYSDLLSYNPYNKGINVLAQLPPHYDDAYSSQKNYLRGKHRHRLSLKQAQSNVADAKSAPSNSDYPRYASAVCRECRLHFKVETIFDDGDELDGFSRKPCPTEGFPLHHFRYDDQKSEPVIDPTQDSLTSDPPERQDVKFFTCTAPQCGIGIKITVSAARVTAGFKDLLTSNSKLVARNQNALRHHKEKLDDAHRTIKPATPTKALYTLRTYLSNVIKIPDGRNIPVHNPRFMECIGEECSPIMKRMKFTMNEDETEWIPPRLPEQDAPYLDETLKLYDDWIQELTILQDNMRASSGADERIFSYIPVEAEEHFKSIFGCANYETRNRVVDLTKEEHPHYASLGAQDDFSDRLLLWAYQRQKECDVPNKPYYLECLNDIAQGRRSEELQMEVATLRSQGEYTSKDIKDAYTAIGAAQGSKEEDLIIGIFNSRLQDSPRQEAALRENLKLIGQHLGSTKIINSATRAITDVRQAYARLAVNEDTDAEYIISSFEVSLSENPSDETALREALKCIAEDRKSHVLLNFIETGSPTAPVMDVDEAFQRLGIPNKDLADEDILAVFNLRLGDSPGQISDFRVALKAIAEKRDSHKLRAFLATGQEGAPIPKGQSDWPVGLENIGNTCYLNSLLQFYFTVKPLREVISKYQEFQEDDPSEENLDKKRVGGRKVTQKEVERAKKFVTHLQQLFKSMVVSPLSAVTPERELAYLALVPSREDSESRPYVETTPAEFIGPLLPGETRSTDIIALEQKSLAFDMMDVEEHLKTRPLQVVNDDVGSEATLVGEGEFEVQLVRKSGDEDYIMVDDEDDDDASRSINKENQSPSPDPFRSQDLLMTDPVDRDTEPLLGGESNSMSDDIPSLISGGVGEDEVGQVGAGLAAGQPLTPPPDLPERPERPPPVPPRPDQKHSRKDSELMFTLGRQQDVTECIENVMFQIESALRPEAVDKEGEQLDVIKRLFYGKTKQSLEIPGSSTRHKEEYFSHLLVDVAEGNRDIYSALDSIFDASSVDLEGKEAKRYVSLIQLPPILQIQIQRVQFDRSTGTPFKSEFQLKFSDVIYLDRYMDTGDQEIIARREEKWKWKSELAALQKQKEALTAVNKDDLSLPQVLKTTSAYLKEIKDELDDGTGSPVDDETISTLAQESENLNTRAQELDVQIKGLEERIADQFQDLKQYGYHIHSIFIHRGSVSFGHYWIYIYDFQRQMYRKYNDGYVEEVKDMNEVFGHGTGQPATPYFLVFVRADNLDWTEAVCRNIEAELSLN